MARITLKKTHSTLPKR